MDAAAPESEEGVPAPPPSPEPERKDEPQPAQLTTMEGGEEVKLPAAAAPNPAGDPPSRLDGNNGNDGDHHGSSAPPPPIPPAPAAPAPAAPVLRLKVVKSAPPPPLSLAPSLGHPTAAPAAAAGAAVLLKPQASFGSFASSMAPSSLSLGAGPAGGGSGGGGLKLRLPKPPPPPPSDGSMKLKLRRPPPPPPPKRSKAQRKAVKRKKGGLDAWLSSSSESESESEEEEEEEKGGGQEGRAAARAAAKREEEDEWARAPYPTTKFDRLVAMQRRRFPSVTDDDDDEGIMLQEADKDEAARKRAGMGKKAWGKAKQAMAAAKAKAKAAVRIVGEGEGPEAATAEALIGVVRLRGLHPTLFVRKDGQGLGLTVPPAASFCVRDVASLIGPEEPVPVMDVGRQEECAEGSWTLGRWSEYYHGDRAQQKRDGRPLLNVISLEVSSYPRLASMVQAPAFVRAVDWVDTVWPPEKKVQGDYPKVQLYCLMGVRGAYTDWHVDFGGSSVWYNVLQGAKEFFLAPPTEENLWAFEKWVSSRQQGSVFFGDKAAGVFRLTVRAGQTLLIPPGWIHAVYTPEDALAFGGNFLNGYHMKQQIAIAQLERRTHVGPESRFPHFERTLFYALAHYTHRIRLEGSGVSGGGGSRLSEMEKLGLPALTDYLERVLPDHMAAAQEVAAQQEPPTTPLGLLEGMKALLKEQGLQGALSLAATRAKRAPKRKDLDFGGKEENEEAAAQAALVQRKRKAKAAKKRQQQTQQQLSLPRAPRPVGMIDDESSGSESEEEGMQESLFGRRRRPAHLRDYEVYAGADDDEGAFASSSSDDGDSEGGGPDDDAYSDTDAAAEEKGGRGGGRGRKRRRRQAFIGEDEDEEEEGGDDDEEGGKRRQQRQGTTRQQPSASAPQQMPPNHPALLSKTYSLSTLPALGGQQQQPQQQPLSASVPSGGMGGIGAGLLQQAARKENCSKVRKDKKTIARIKKLIKYKK